LTVAVQLATAAWLPKKKTPRRSRDMRVSFFKISLLSLIFICMRRH